ncbi:hypothetical protein JZ785_24240 [Alicyclobacillus curvatus]|jgi:uncharacterized protein YlxW (UPF0749 family)|nr:hypothetical protein JZ785_24240 [Alicyclobacillus curvatus]
MSVKPWQKATLSVMAGGTVYAGFLYTVTYQTQLHNQEVLKQEQQIVSEDKALAATLQQKETQLISLEKQLQSEQKNTATIAAEIKGVNLEISQIKAGHVPGAPVTASSVAVSVATTPIMKLPTVSAPAVQTVTKSS